MTDPDPIGSNDPYEILGVAKTDTLSTIETQKDSLVDKYQQEALKARKEGDNQTFKRANQALDAIDEAWEWLEKNHTPPLIDEPVSVSVTTADIVVGSPVTVEVTGDGGPVSEAKVEVDRPDIDSKQTDANGETTFTFGEYGTARVTVPTTDAYADATAEVDISRRPVQLSFRSPPSTVEVNDDAAFVVVGDGETLSGVDVTADGSPIGTTGSDGSLTHSFTSTGSKTIEASKTDDDECTYETCNHDLQVSAETVELDVQVDGSDFRVGDDVDVVVSEASDSDATVEGAEVVVGSNSETTDAKGNTSLPLDSAGKVTITASKTAPNGPRNYTDGEAKIPVSRRQGGLHIADVDGERMERNDLAVRVEDDGGNPLPGATVSSNWGHDETTDDTGEATVSLTNSGNLVLTATKQTDEVDYGEDKRKLTIEEFTRELVIDQCPETANPGETIEVVVTDNAGQAIHDAEVRCDDQPGEIWRTDGDGKAQVDLSNRLGVRKIWAMKEGDEFGEDDENVHVLNW